MCVCQWLLINVLLSIIYSSCLLVNVTFSILFFKFTNWHAIFHSLYQSMCHVSLVIHDYQSIYYVTGYSLCLPTNMPCFIDYSKYLPINVLCVFRYSSCLPSVICYSLCLPMLCMVGYFHVYRSMYYVWLVIHSFHQLKCHVSFVTFVRVTINISSMIVSHIWS